MEFDAVLDLKKERKTVSWAGDLRMAELISSRLCSAATKKRLWHTGVCIDS
jgi:hypothetical protein